MDETQDDSPQSSVVEVTNSLGKVGFVAVSRHNNSSSSFHNSISNNNENTSSSNQNEFQNFTLPTTSAEQTNISFTHDENIIPSSRSVSQSHISRSEVSINVCKQCGQDHTVAENHQYNYIEESDEDLQCDICLQPFVNPFDTKCSHTFCELCLRNHIKLKSFCPIDREKLTLSSTDSWESSKVLSKLLNKLSVHCPNSEFCQEIVHRGELANHLNDKCPGSIVRCERSLYGCSYRGSRCLMYKHNLQCAYSHLKAKPLASFYPEYKKHVIEVYRKELGQDLGILIVGGCDTPLKDIVVQDTITGSAIGVDGRIESGDILIEANGESFHNIQHVEARKLLSSLSRLVRFVLLRLDKDLERFQSDEASEVFTITLHKPITSHLGIKITAKEEEEGIFVLDILQGSVAAESGKLKVNDRILSVSGVEMMSSSDPEEAARVISESYSEVVFVISRKKEEAGKKIPPRRLPPPLPISSTSSQSTCDYHYIRVGKRFKENLGIVVAGGTEKLQSLPIFIRDILENGIMDRDKRLRKGDILLSVNNSSLVGCTHEEAVSTLKDVAHGSRVVVFKICRLGYPNKKTDMQMWDRDSAHNHHRRSGVHAFFTSPSSPSWRMWFALPIRHHISIKIIIKRPCNVHDIGIRVCKGGKNYPLCLIKNIVKGSIASLPNYNIQCGDLLLSINNNSTSECSLPTIKALLSPPYKVFHLTVIPLPGSLH